MIKNLYHGTNKNFEAFSKDFLGSNTEWENCNIGFYFSEEIGMAQLFGNNVLECSLNVSKPLDIYDLLKESQQACDIVKILMLEEIKDPKEAVKLIDDNTGLGDIEEFYESFNQPDIIDEFKDLGYDHIVSRFSEGKVQVCVLDPMKIEINKSDVISDLLHDQVSILALNDFQQKNVITAIESKDSRQLEFLSKQLKKNIESIPSIIDGDQIDTKKKLMILAGINNGDFGINYQIENKMLYRSLNSLSQIISPVLSISVSNGHANKKNISMSY